VKLIQIQYVEVSEAPPMVHVLHEGDQISVPLLRWKSPTKITCNAWLIIMAVRGSPTLDIRLSILMPQIADEVRLNANTSTIPECWRTCEATAGHLVACVWVSMESATGTSGRRVVCVVRRVAVDGNVVCC
jgi:hypothetical protein